MDAMKMHVMMEIKDFFKTQGKDNTDIAEQVHKDVTVVAKQFSDKNGSQTLATAYGYAEAAGGRIIFVSDEDYDLWQKMKQEMPEMQSALKDREQRLRNMSETVKSMAAQIESQTKIIQRLEKQLDDKDESIRRKETVIARKDGVIADLLRKAGVIE